jgi:hypothetical protein
MTEREKIILKLAGYVKTLPYMEAFFAVRAKNGRRFAEGFF